MGYDSWQLSVCGTWMGQPGQRSGCDDVANSKPGLNCSFFVVAGSNKAALQQLIQCDNCTSASWEQLRFRCMNRTYKHRASQAAGGDDEVMAGLNPEDPEHVDEDVLVEEAATPADPRTRGRGDSGGTTVTRCNTVVVSVGK